MEKLTKRLLLALAMVGVAIATMATVKIDAHAAKGTTTVYVSTTNVDYHADGCKNLGKDKIPVSLNDAVTLGFTQCKSCKAPALDGAKVTTASAAQPAGDMVWLSASGEKYHKKNNCGSMNPAKARQVSISEAKARGIAPCKKCFK